MKLQFRGALTQGFPTKAGILGVILPTTWATANITFQVSQDNVTFHDLYSDTGAEVAVTVSATGAHAVTFDSKGESLAPFQYARIRSGVSATPVSQGTEAQKVFTFGENKTLTFKSGLKGTIGNEIRVGFETNTEDTLAVDASGKEITVKLASDTASKNSAADIETLVQGLTVADIDVTAFTVTESAGYEAARPTAVKGVGIYDIKVLDGEDLVSAGTLTFTAGVGGAGGDFVRDIVWGVSDEDELAVSVNDSNQLVIQFAKTTASKNTALAIQTAIQALTGTALDAYTGALTVAGDATYNATPVASFDSVGLVTEGTVEALDIAVDPISANLTGGVDLEIELCYK
jgi:hypothetical protein